jgi:hypothetical protein
VVVMNGGMSALGPSSSRNAGSSAPSTSTRSSPLSAASCSLKRVLHERAGALGFLGVELGLVAGRQRVGQLLAHGLAAGGVVVNRRQDGSGSSWAAVLVVVCSFMVDLLRCGHSDAGPLRPLL